MKTKVKICGIKTPDALRAACDAGARFVGFVFYPPSVRALSIDTAKELALMLPTGVRGVGLFVNPSDELLQEVIGKVQLDMIQLHGDESTQRVQEVKSLTQLEVMKALPIKAKDDLETIKTYEEVSDWILCDTPSTGYGGSGESFDWNLLQGYQFTKPWMLAGGLTAQNVSEAISALSPSAVDVSSGVESERGVKDISQIKAFVEAVKCT